MTSKHTPGPWAVQNAEDCMGRKLDDMVGWVVTAEDHDLWISTGPTWDPEHVEESEANARLIAAAPELLEALAEAVACGMVPISSAKEGGASAHSRQVRCADMIRAAIAKATGGAA